MPRPRTGSVFPHGDHFDIQVTLPNGQRSRRMCQEPGMSEAKAREKALVASQLAAKEGIGVVPKRTTKGVAPVAPPPSETFEAWAERWCKAREERGLTSVKDDRGRLRKWVLPLWRDKPIAAWNAPTWRRSWRISTRTCAPTSSPGRPPRMCGAS